MFFSFDEEGPGLDRGLVVLRTGTGYRAGCWFVGGQPLDSHFHGQDFFVVEGGVDGSSFFKVSETSGWLGSPAVMTAAAPP